MIPDYKIHVISMLHQPEEVRQRYQSDYRVIADYLACFDQGKDKMMEQMRGNKKKLLHVEQTLDMLNAFSGDRRFEEIKNMYQEMEEDEKGEKSNMCDLLDAVEEEGEEKRARDVAKRMMEDDVPIEKIAHYVDIAPEVLEEWLN